MKEIKKRNPTIKRKVKEVPLLEYTQRNVFKLIRSDCNFSISYRRLPNNEFRNGYNYYNGKRYKFGTFFGVRRKTHIIHTIDCIAKGKEYKRNLDYIRSHNTSDMLKKLSNKQN